MACNEQSELIRILVVPHLQDAPWRDHACGRSGARKNKLAAAVDDASSGLLALPAYAVAKLQGKILAFLGSLPLDASVQGRAQGSMKKVMKRAPRLLVLSRT